MMPTFYGFLAGMIIGLIAAGVFATLLLLPAGVSYQQLTLGDVGFECISWHDETICEIAKPKLSMERQP